MIVDLAKKTREGMLRVDNIPVRIFPKEDAPEVYLRTFVTGRKENCKLIV